MTYNQLFERFYDDDEDQVRGLIAYGLYKIAKREWATQFHQQHGRSPDATELAAYQNTWTPAVIAGKQSEADQVLRAYSDEVVKQEKPQIVENALRGSFWKTVWTNTFSAMIYTLLLVAFLVIIKLAGVDVVSIANALG